MERETGIEPATNSLEGCDSTIELLPRSKSILAFARADPVTKTISTKVGLHVEIDRQNGTFDTLGSRAVSSVG